MKKCAKCGAEYEEKYDACPACAWSRQRWYQVAGLVLLAVLLWVVGRGTVIEWGVLVAAVLAVRLAVQKSPLRG